MKNQNDFKREVIFIFYLFLFSIGFSVVKFGLSQTMFGMIGSSLAFNWWHERKKNKKKG